MAYIDFSRTKLHRTVEALVWRALILVPAVVSIWCLNRSGTYRALIFEGGWTTRFYVLAWIILTPYLGWIVLATGRLTFSLIKHDAARRIDEFFVGASTLILVGLTLGAFSILYPQLVLGSLLAILLWDTRSFRKPKRTTANYALLSVSLVSFAALGMVFLDRAAMPDVVSTDVQQLYAPYLAEVARNHSIWLAADNPIFSDFEIGHGNGLHLLMATFLPPQVTQIISFLYFVAIGGVIFELVRMLVPLEIFGPQWGRMAVPIALGIAVLGLTWAPGIHIMEFGKYHLQTAAFFFYSLLAVARSPKGRDNFGAGICGLALTVSYPLYTAYLVLISGLGAFTKLLQGDRSGLITSVALGGGAVVGCVLAFAINYFYLGIPATNPYSIFRHVASTDRFSQFGSFDILDYFVFSQSLGVSDFSIRNGWISATGQVKAIVKAAALLTVTSLVVAFADSKLFPARSPPSRSMPTGLVAGGFILLAYLASVRFLDSTLQIPSLQRLSIHVNALIPVTIIAMAFWALTIAWRLAPTWFSGRVAPHIAVLSLLMMSASVVHAVPWRSFQADGTLLFVNGRPLDQMPRVTVNWKRCDDLQQSTDSDRVLALNGYRAMVPCYFSSLLTRGKIIHTYQSDVARNFTKIALGDAGTAEATLRSLGVKLFYVQKDNCDFWLNGFSDLFQKEELARRFAIHRETPEYWILTWKHNDQSLSPAAANGISALRTRSKEIYQEAYGVDPFEVVKHRLPPDGRRGDLNILEKLFRCY
ncbi:hypothetical protein LPJ38_28760 [Bradyrhizobium daqingense]|uniref:4-amino-4-deoxy-L-arabinose transferase-like glycosyltransferase n=1 Tax=Bradyrhizobium daqingense TaxID=993502 RepID=A0A562LLG9_9BRAD|nr:hypothetical protein [Bradyrhizobium daqingense]TWI08467.1 hypothetical protein IQ17_01286 [Bradyrhizobium daqingense]UFS87601.1 hypothetical protein LPJ38_28760 [Bradyrhizobium daqingense]